jgi:hypothetical protein
MAGRSISGKNSLFSSSFRERENHSSGVGPFGVSRSAAGMITERYEDGMDYYPAYSSDCGASTFECSFCKKMKKGEPFIAESKKMEKDIFGSYYPLYYAGTCCKRLLNFA